MVKIFQKFPEIKTEFRIVDIADFQIDSPDVAMIKEQLHSDKIFYVTDRKTDIQGDGMFTDKAGLKLGVRTADCLPVLFYNPAAGVVGAVHAGWKGTEKHILKKAVQEVVDRFQAKVEDFYFYFGPAAQNCCYDRDFLRKNKEQLLELRVDESHIEVSDVCTVHNDNYPSHSREKQDRQKSTLSIIEKKL